MLFAKLRGNRTLFFVILAILFIVVVLLVTKGYLMFNFLIGNDTIIKLNVDNEYVFLQHENEEEIKFETKVTTNPFCSAVCSYAFIDLSNNEMIDNGEFLVKPTNPNVNSFNIKADKFGRGKEYYKFDLSCVSEGGFLCHSDKEKTTRDLIVTVEYDLNDDEKNSKSEIENKTLALASYIANLDGTLNVIENATNVLNQTVILDYNIDELKDELKEKKLDLIGFSLNENYFISDDELTILSDEILNLREMVSSLDNNLSYDAVIYNNLIDDLNNSRDKLNNNFLIGEFNIVLDKFLQRDLLENKKLLIEDIKSKIENSTELNETLNSANEVNFQKIEFDDLVINEIQLEFFEIKSICRIDNLDSECGADEDNYPLVFLHGHAVVKDSPLEYSLEGFSGLQGKVEEEGYLDAGSISLYTNKDVPINIWDMNKSLSIRASYYFDLFKEPENYKIVLTKSENIDTYAVRMKEVFDNIRQRTGKDKVDVIAFSMGGLVMRRHMQLFGSEGFNHVILLGTPNKGIIGDVATLCPVVGGEKRECDDMRYDSLFMQKLNSQKVPSNIHNIYGIGCDMNLGTGDGIVLEEKAKLDGIDNYIIYGVCRGKLVPLHLDLLSVERYPEVFDIISDILKN